MLLFPAEEKQLQLAYGKLHVLLQRFAEDNDTLEKRVKDGKLLTGQIRIGGTDAAVFWYQINGPALFIDTLISVAEGSFLPKLAKTIEDFARSLNCKYVDCATARRGMVQHLTGIGYYASSVTLRKDL